jgi:capsid protein
MMELPSSMRELLVEQLNEFCENLDDTSDTSAIAEQVVELIEQVTHEVPGVSSADIISRLESSGEMDASLSEVLEDTFDSAASFDYTGEELVTLLEKLCEIEWLDGDEEEGGSGFFGAEADGEEDF